MTYIRTFSGEAESSWRTVVANPTVRIPSHRAPESDEPREEGAFYKADLTCQLNFTMEEINFKFRYLAMVTGGGSFQIGE